MIVAFYCSDCLLIFVTVVFYRRSIPGVVLIEPWKFSLDYKKSFELPISSANKWKNCILYI